MTSLAMAAVLSLATVTADDIEQHLVADCRNIVPGSFFDQLFKASTFSTAINSNYCYGFTVKGCV